jgi:hypothetical protein
LEPSRHRAAPLTRAPFRFPGLPIRGTIPPLAEIYRREIDFAIDSLWDAEFRVRIGDDQQGFDAERVFDRDAIEQIADWLLVEAARLHPEAFRDAGP